MRPAYPILSFRQGTRARSLRNRVRGYNAEMPNKTSGAFAPLPSTLERSPKKAQETYEQTLEAAETEYPGDEARAHRTAWAAVKHSFEKTGDHWSAKAERGPSDERSAQGGAHAT